MDRYKVLEDQIENTISEKCLFQFPPVAIEILETSYPDCKFKITPCNNGNGYYIYVNYENRMCRYTITSTSIKRKNFDVSE